MSGVANDEAKATLPKVRSRVAYCVALLCVVCLGLATRRYPEAFPAWFAQYAGDTLWSLALFLFLGTLFSRAGALPLATACLAISFAVECSQLYQAPWAQELRSNRLAALFLGRGFLWSDFACYTIGVIIGYGSETIARSFTPFPFFHVDPDRGEPGSSS
ncbi:MAG: DUF2809 domain-containing protein [Aureliella sp.]